jgi:hypothetical protein
MRDPDSRLSHHGQVLACSLPKLLRQWRSASGPHSSRTSGNLPMGEIVLAVGKTSAFHSTRTPYYR